jgi:multicomponent Na+:H+ antiporter subunit B
MSHLIIPRVMAKVMIPFILLYALYVQFHGDYSPGGGFQAGVIFAAAVILYTLIFRVKEAERAVRPAAVRVIGALGLLLYAGVGVVTLFLGGDYLEYGVLDGHDPVHGQHLGILLVELGVGICVAAVMISVFYAFVDLLRAK